MNSNVIVRNVLINNEPTVVRFKETKPEHYRVTSRGKPTIRIRTRDGRAYAKTPGTEPMVATSIERAYTSAIKLYWS